MWLDNLLEMKRASKKTIKQISEESGVPLGTLNKLFSGQTEDPKLNTLKSVVYCLGYTLADLDTPAEVIKNTPSLEDGDEDMLKLYHRLDTNDRLMIQGEIRGLLLQEKYRKDSSSAAG